MNDLNNLKNMIGEQFNNDNIICNMIDKNDAVIVSDTSITSNFEGYGTCNLYNCYYDNQDSNIYNIWVDDDNIIVDVN